MLTIGFGGSRPDRGGGGPVWGGRGAERQRYDHGVSEAPEQDIGKDGMENRQLWGERGGLTVRLDSKHFIYTE